MTPELERIKSIKSFPSLVKYLREELEWKIDDADIDLLEPRLFQLRKRKKDALRTGARLICLSRAKKFECHRCDSAR